MSWGRRSLLVPDSVLDSVQDSVLDDGDSRPALDALEQQWRGVPDTSNEAKLRLRWMEAALASGDEFPTLGELPQALDCATWQRALNLLSEGRWAEGFAAYERRLLWWAPRGLGPLGMDWFLRSTWVGQPLKGRRLLVMGEQGYGDQVMFWRFVPRLAAMGAQVVLGVNAALKPLAQRWLGDSVVSVLAWGDPIPPCDWHVALCSLPHRLGVTQNSELAWPVATRPQRRPRLQTSSRPRIGLCWAGKPTHGMDAYRSVSWADIAPFVAAASSRCDWVSVQPGWGGERPAGLRAEDAGVSNFAELADLLDSLDGLITVDSAPVHVAGSLGLPTCMLDRALHPDWRWGDGSRLGRDWYSSVTVLRQSVPGNWQVPMGQALRYFDLID